MKKLVFSFGLMLFCRLLDAQSQSELLKGYETTNCNVLKIVYNSLRNGGAATSKEKVAMQWPLSIERELQRSFYENTQTINQNF
jgi:hypothetical protein